MSVDLPVIVQPDLEAWVWEQIRDLPGVTSWSYASTQLDPMGWLYAWLIQVDARSSRRPPARSTAELVRQRLMALTVTPWAGGTVTYVQPVEGPFWLPDTDGHPRYVARYEIRVHPTRQLAASP